MKAEAGFGAVALIAVAAFFGISSQQGGKSAPATAVRAAPVASREPSEPTAKSAFASGGCGELEETIRTFLLAPGDGVAAPASCYAGDARASKEKLAQQDAGMSAALRAKTGNMQFVIAILPDPVHTHFSLMFDRFAEAIQQGAQDEEYFYDSSWLPWEKNSAAGMDRDKSAEQQAKAREDQPGILLFRKRVSADKNCPELGSEKPEPADQPYCDGLAVFLVGEEPTNGIHKRQFENALDWISALQANDSVAPKAGVKILGPTFSGSLPSLAQLVSDPSHTQQLAGFAASSPGGKLAIFSGSITDVALVKWFAGLPQTSGKVEFRSFQTDGDTLLRRYREYLKSEGFDLARLAIVSEDETAYGGYATHGVSAGACAPTSGEPIGPACLYYPRDISALRDAYQKQSIFNTGSTTSVATSTAPSLATDLADPEDRQHDSVRNYSGNQTPLSQEAVLQQIVSMLRAHQSQYIVLRSSNPLDQLFLSHFLRLTYPEGRIVVEGSDLLLRRETGAATLSGIMTLTTYPLLPWAHHWTAAAASSDPAARFYSHAHRVFAQDLAEGNYVATRFLLNADRIGCAVENHPEELSIANRYFLPPNCINRTIPDYAAPFWTISRNAGESSSVSGKNDERPSTWLSVLGRDGFWPLAALNSFDQLPAAAVGAAKTEEPSPWVRRRHSVVGSVQSLGHLVLAVFGLRPSEESVDGRPQWPPMPLSMKICLLLLSFWSAFHFYCCLRPSITVKPGYRAHFVRIQDEHCFLVIFGSSVISMMPVLLAWGYGAMSLQGEPVPHAWWYRAFLPFTWILAGAAVGANTWVESGKRLHSGRREDREHLGRRVMRKIRSIRFVARVVWRPVASYAVITCLFYCVVDIFLNESLSDSNRLPTFWRAINLTTGVSPLTPLLALAGGLYLWFWYTLQGLSLFGQDRPILPHEAELQVEMKYPVTLPTKRPSYFEWTSHKLNSLGMFSQELVATPLEALCQPLTSRLLWRGGVLFFAVWAGGLLLAGGDVPIRNLGSQDYSLFYCLGMDVCLSLALVSAWQLLRVWLRLRQLLLFLDRTPLRRTMKSLKGYSWGSVWKMSGNVLDVRYKLLSRQFESLTHLMNSLRGSKIEGAERWIEQIQKTQRVRAEFADWYARHWDDWRARDLSKLEAFQASVAETCGMIFSDTLVSEWRTESESLILDASETKADGVAAKSEGTATAGSANTEYLRNAEELVCLVYLGFIQNILGRIRTLVMAMLWVFVAATVSVATYPFDPRPVLSGSLLVLFTVLGAVIVLVYAQMHRDATLSYVTNTNPGELGSEFWLKLLSFGAGPAVGLLAAVFPELPGSIFSWLQPGISSLK